MIDVLVVLVLFGISIGNLTGFFLSGLPVPKLISVINQEMNQVELQSAGSNKSLLCIQYEGNGKCRVSVVCQGLIWGTNTVCLLLSLLFAFVFLSYKTFRSLAEVKVAIQQCQAL